jgi:hypothetical protein
LRADPFDCRIPVHECLDARGDLLLEAGAVEDAVMPDTSLKMVLLLRIRQIGREVERRNRLAASGDIVLLPLMLMRAQRWIALSPDSVT